MVQPGASESPSSGLRAAHVRLVGAYWARFSLRTGGGILALLLLLIAGVGIAGTFISPVEMIMESSPELGHTEREAAATIEDVAQSDLVRRTVGWVTGANDREVEYLLRGNPALLSVIMLVFLIAFPFTACVAGFNQTAGDIGNRGLRYLLLRTERANIFLGRFVGTIVFAALGLALLFGVVVLYVGFKFGIYGWGELALWSVQGFFAALFVMLPYIALCAWASAMLDGAFAAFAISLLLAGFPVLLLKLTDAALRGDQGWLERLTPWGWKYELLSVHPGTRALAYAAMLGFTCLFLFLGLRHFGRRDL